MLPLFHSLLKPENDIIWVVSQLFRVPWCGGVCDCWSANTVDHGFFTRSLFFSMKDRPPRRQPALLMRKRSSHLSWNADMIHRKKSRESRVLIQEICSRLRIKYYVLLDVKDQILILLRNTDTVLSWVSTLMWDNLGCLCWPKFISREKKSQEAVSEMNRAVKAGILSSDVFVWRHFCRQCCGLIRCLCILTWRNVLRSSMF